MNVEVVWHVMRRTYHLYISYSYSCLSQLAETQYSAVGIWKWFFSLSASILVAAIDGITCNNVEVGKREWKSKNYFPLQTPHRMARTRGGAAIQMHCSYIMLIAHTCQKHKHISHECTCTRGYRSDRHKRVPKLRPHAAVQWRALTFRSTFMVFVFDSLFVVRLSAMDDVLGNKTHHIAKYAKYRNRKMLKLWLFLQKTLVKSVRVCESVCMCVSGTSFATLYTSLVCPSVYSIWSPLFFLFFFFLRIVLFYVRHELIKSNEIFLWVCCISSQFIHLWEVWDWKRSQWSDNATDEIDEQ